MKLNYEFRQKERLRCRPLPPFQHRAGLARAAEHLARMWYGSPPSDMDCWLDHSEAESRFARFQVARDRGRDLSATFARNFAPTVPRLSTTPGKAQFPRRPARCETDC